MFARRARTALRGGNREGPKDRARSFSPPEPFVHLGASLSSPSAFALCIVRPDVRDVRAAPVVVLVVVLILRGVDPWWALVVAAAAVLLRTSSG